MRWYKNDMQRNRAYRWEDSLYRATNKADDKDLQEVFKHVIDMFVIDRKSLLYTDKETFKKDFRSRHPVDPYTSYYVNTWVANEKTHLIWLAPVHKRVNILLHEIAHLVVSDKIESTKKYRDIVAKQRKDERIAIHGPEWLTTYMVMLNKILGTKRQILTDSADNFKLQYFPEMLEKYAV